MAYLTNGEGWGARAFIPITGRNLWVTTCEDGPQEGTLRWALTQAVNGPSVIKFRVGGVFALDYLRYNHLRLEGGRRVFIDGFTAPRPVELQRSGLYLGAVEGQASDLVLRGLKIRPGEPGNQEISHGPGGERGLTVYAETGAVTRVLVDHCDLGWTTDDSFNAWGNVTHLTLQWCLLSPGRGYRAVDAAPAPDPIAHKGTLLALPAPPGPPQARWFTIHHCLYAGFYQRCPYVADCTLDFCNNVVVAWRFGAKFLRCHLNIRGNAYLATADPAVYTYERPWIWWPGPDGSGVPRTMEDGSIYVEGNASNQADFDAADPWSLIGSSPGFDLPPRSWRAARPFGESGLMRATSARAAFRAVLAEAGCIQPAKGREWRSRDALSDAAVRAALAGHDGSGLF